MSAPPSLTDLLATWDRQEIVVDQHVVASDGTIQRTQPSRGVEPPPPSVRRADEIEVEDLVGEGGMGRVYVARQPQLGRRIAVKRPRPDVPVASRELLREARVTGALEHPNIVPIHAVNLDESGQPTVVMKYLAGETWAEKLVTRLSRLADLERDLEILEQVTRAVAFAHDQGVIHRDIKPENVMLGSHGEVVVVDWGLALAFRETSVEGVRRAGDVVELAGTLAYMAPEMALGRGSELGPPTDVYLLGATLYELLSGKPPHVEATSSANVNVREALSHIFLEPPPPLPDDVPVPLAEICRRALDFDPEARYASAKEFGEALASYRRGRDSARLLDEATRLLTAAEEHGDIEAPVVGTWLAQARFALEQARPGVRESIPGAAGGVETMLERTLLLSVRREIAKKRPEAADALLEELPASSERLGAESEVTQLRAEVDELYQRQTELERAAADADLGQASVLRRRIGVGFAVCFLALHVVLGFYQRGGSLDHGTYLLATTVLALAFGVGPIVRYEKVFPNDANRRLAFSLGLLLLGQVGTFVAMWWLGVNIAPTLTIGLVQLSCSFAISAVVLERRVLWCAPVALFASVASALVPSMVVELVGITYFAYFLAGALLEWEDPERPIRLLTRGRGSTD